MSFHRACHSWLPGDMEVGLRHVALVFSHESEGKCTLILVSSDPNIVDLMCMCSISDPVADLVDVETSMTETVGAICLTGSNTTGCCLSAVAALAHPSNTSGCAWLP